MSRSPNLKNIILPEVAARLKEIRLQIGCDKKAMAARLGITASGYYKNEHGETLPSVNSLKRLADDFNIAMDWLFLNKGPMHYEEKAKKEMELEQEAFSSFLVFFSQVLSGLGQPNCSMRLTA